MSISIVIATYNRAGLLDECLAHIARQTFEPGDQVIVINNGSTDNTTAVLARHQLAYPVPLDIVVDAQPGKSRALASGIAVATGDVLALTDDDVNVGEQWLDAIRRAMADPEVALIGGPVEPRWQKRAPSWLRLETGSYDRLTAPLALLDYGNESTLLGSRTAIGANLAVRRDVVMRLGGFSQQLGKLRGTLLSGEDHELCERVQSAGFKTMYCPEVRVSHWVPAARTRLRYFLAWFFWSGITHAALDARAPWRGRTAFGVPLYLVRRFLAGLVGAVAAIGVADPRRAVDRTMDVAFASGYAAARLGIVRVGAGRTARAA